jgi:hypothetical protein
MQFQIWPLKMEAQRKFGGVHAMEWLLVAQSGRSQNERLWNPPRKSGRSRAA